MGVANATGGPPGVGVAGGTEFNPFVFKLGFKINELHDGNRFLAVLVKAVRAAASSWIEVDLIISEICSELEVGRAGVWPAIWGLASLANVGGRGGRSRLSSELALGLSMDGDGVCRGLPLGLEAGGGMVVFTGLGVQGELEVFAATVAVLLGVAGEFEGFVAEVAVLIATNGVMVSRRPADGGGSSALILCETDWHKRPLTDCTALQHVAHRIVPSSDEHDEAWEGALQKPQSIVTLKIEKGKREKGGRRR
jgi:hypothetical protein